MKTVYTKRLEVEIVKDVDVAITDNDVFNWLTACDNPETLQKLGKYAMKRARQLSVPSEDDDFRSRA